MAGFRGWPVEAIGFFESLEADNSRTFWTAHRDVYESEVLAPMKALGEEVHDEFGPLHIFRPNRDVRFSKDKSPYKTQCGAVTEGDDGEVFYVQVSAEGLFVASGYYQMARDQLERFRLAVVDEVSGPDLVTAIEQMEEGGYDIGGSALKTAPRGFDREHPRVRFLRHKGLTVSKSFPPRRWLGTRAALERITNVWRGAQPVNTWLGKHVGPSQEPPDERW